MTHRDLITLDYALWGSSFHCTLSSRSDLEIAMSVLEPSRSFDPELEVAPRLGRGARGDLMGFAKFGTENQWSSTDGRWGPRRSSKVEVGRGRPRSRRADRGSSGGIANWSVNHLINTATRAYSRARLPWRLLSITRSGIPRSSEAYLIVIGCECDWSGLDSSIAP